MELLEILRQAVQRQASDIFLITGGAVSVKAGGRIVPLGEARLKSEETQATIGAIYTLAERSGERLREKGDDDFSFSVKGLGRFRCNAYKQRGSLAAVLRVVSFSLPDAQALHIPEAVTGLYKKRKGLVLITGPAGSGKSTTLACLIDRINRTYTDHVITIEDPIEYLHAHRESLVSQREIGQDTENYAQALRAALRQAPDVILLGEMRDFETIQTALTAAETGQLVLSTLHTVGAAKTIDRIIDVFPSQQQQQIRVQLSLVLEAVVSQQLIPDVDGGLFPAFEVMMANSAVRNMIRESKVYQLDNVIYAGAAEGMISMDADLLRLYREGRISKENALLYSTNMESMQKKIAALG